MQETNQVYKTIANGSWKKEEELQTLKGQAAELNRKIGLTLAPEEEVQEIQNENIVSNNLDKQPTVNATKEMKELDEVIPNRTFANQAEYTAKYKHLKIDSSEDSLTTKRRVFSKPKWKM